ncbi:TPA: hypothetical protein DD690_01430 [Candidatus Daviesbacteria bacterium]|nr:MAG: hypothetical protein A3D02_02750 [Candidatus Daviesbacteria bacterium RIFCSPHIGHO2_02_FULL_39_41]OGE67582.1 MAG: hypothetical protein A3H81_01065 [Candidatus Daviesbacteria bacterium RIFCSPLOWO2_02_FULL_38_18]HBQ50626.1 hypothetical protein [Candidatus Daviesbacteria bacterium]HCB22684.1 hypothetical protein [Candidatus Daviesbacteria bacterium]
MKRIILLLAISAFVIVNTIADSQNLQKPISFGVSFSPRYALELGLNPKLTYQSILQELGTKSVRLSAYWDEIESEEDKFNFDKLDWYVDEAEKNQAKVLLAIGYKLPRWPECRQPNWLEIRNSLFDSKLAQSEQVEIRNLRDQQLVMLEKVIRHYDQNPTISAWQVENEPLLDFGLCPKPDREFLKKEVGFVKNLTKKPVIITDSGELRLWFTPAKLSDILGITLYRTVETPIFGSFHYPFPPWFYRLKANLVRKKTIVVELQTEPWSREPLSQTPLEEQIKRFPPKSLQKNIEFARQTGFKEIYLWGAEWWYFMAANSHPEYLEYARGLFK